MSWREGLIWTRKYLHAVAPLGILATFSKDAGHRLCNKAVLLQRCGKRQLAAVSGGGQNYNGLCQESMTLNVHLKNGKKNPKIIVTHWIIAAFYNEVCGLHPASVAEEGRCLLNPKVMMGMEKARLQLRVGQGGWGNSFMFLPAKPQGIRITAAKTVMVVKASGCRSCLQRRCINRLETSAEKDRAISLKSKLQNPFFSLKKPLCQET